MTIRAWYMDSDESNQRAAHYGETCSLDVLDKLGVLRWEGLTGPDDVRLEEIRKARGYTYNDFITINPEKLPDYGKQCYQILPFRVIIG